MPILFAACLLGGCATPPEPVGEVRVLQGGAAPIPPAEVGAGKVYVDELATPPDYAGTTGFGEKADWAHDALFDTVQRNVAKVDALFVKEGEPKERVPISRFRLGLYADAVEKERFEFSVEPDFEVELETPNIERSLSLVITTEELGELPGTDPNDREPGLRLGLHKEWLAMFAADAGIEWSWPPDPFAQIGWNRNWQASAWKVYPGWKGFWRLEEGFGTTATLTGDRWFGRGLFRLSSGGRWTEQTEGLEWSQTVILGHARELIEEHRLGGRANGRDLACGYGIRYRLTGDSDADVLQTHSALLFVKVPLRKQWAYLVVAPELTWRNERDWEAEYGIQLGLDLLFWNHGDR